MTIEAARSDRAWALRSASVEDSDRLALIGAATFLETFAGVLDGAAIIAHCQAHHASPAYRALLETGGAAWLAETERGSAPIGYALVAKPDLPGSRAGDLELKRIYVLSRFHGSGAGRALLDAAVTHAVAANAERLLPGVYEDNRRAIDFYRNSGFQPIGTRQFNVGGRHYGDVVFAMPLR